MQDWPLLVSKILDHAARWHGEQAVVSRTVEGPIYRYTYGGLAARARRLASSLVERLGIAEGQVIATMAWNTHRHVESWYALMGIGAVVHTLNPRLFADQLVYIINHAEDRLVFLDLSFVELFEKLAPRLDTVEGYVIMTGREHMPKSTTLANVACYEELIGDGREDFAWPQLDENSACGMCYTSGTTGHPKGVVYSHRSNVLHALAGCSADALGLSSRDSVMPVVPMFHANAWALAFSVPMAGAKLVLPGPKLDGASLYELLDGEKVSCTAAVPTVWLMLLQHLEQNPHLRLPFLERVVIGGSACSEALMRKFVESYDTDVLHAWGMTEMSPLGTLGTRSAATAALAPGEWWKLKLKQGRPPFTVDMKITDDAGRALPHDGETFGRLKVKGPAVARAYYKGEGADSFDDEGWFDTGDVATLDPWGYMRITDRSKDIIKSGGEWISSIELENVAMSCEGVAEAAAVGMPHPKWSERPVLVVVRKEGSEVSKEAILAFLAPRVAKWWLPDDVVFAPDIPHTATGKISKLALRQRMKDYALPGG
jgi:fatty-acyl-CoA synthase